MNALTHQEWTALADAMEASASYHQAEWGPDSGGFLVELARKCRENAAQTPTTEVDL